MTPCPSCGGVLEAVTDALLGIVMMRSQGGQLYTVLQPRTVVACTECEYAQVTR